MSVVSSVPLITQEQGYEVLPSELIHCDIANAKKDQGLPFLIILVVNEFVVLNPGGHTPDPFEGCSVSILP